MPLGIPRHLLYLYVLVRPTLFSLDYGPLSQSHTIGRRVRVVPNFCIFLDLMVFLWAFPINPMLCILIPWCTLLRLTRLLLEHAIFEGDVTWLHLVPYPVPCS
jgi:hypothetical protein